MDPSKCKNASGSDGYCKKPDDQACPGYKQAMFNGQQICVKDSSNTPNPNDPLISQIHLIQLHQIHLKVVVNKAHSIVKIRLTKKLVPLVITVRSIKVKKYA
jgi:hypothetical protein